jgi:hypothetical protein
METIRSESVAQRIVVSLWVCALVVGTVCHVLDIVRGGWLPYRRYALGLNLFWTALTFADPLAALLLIYRRRAGVYVALSIISIDVAVNSAVGVGEFVKSGHFTFWGLYTQVPVGVFMWTTAPMLWRSDGRDLALDSHEA